MSGYQTVIRLRRIEQQVDELGFMLVSPKHGGWDSNDDRVGLKPKDTESVPIYARDAEVFCGSLEELVVWIRGVQWARDYDKMLKVSNEVKRARKEQDVRNKQMVQRLKSENVDHIEN